MEVAELKKVKLDEIEMCLELLKQDHPKTIHNATYLEIATLIQNNFGVSCSEEQVFLLHEPTIDQDMEDTQIHYNLLGYYE